MMETLFDGEEALERRRLELAAMTPEERKADKRKSKRLHNIKYRSKKGVKVRMTPEEAEAEYLRRQAMTPKQLEEERKRKHREADKRYRERLKNRKNDTDQ